MVPATACKTTNNGAQIDGHLFSRIDLASVLIIITTSLLKDHIYMITLSVKFLDY